ncbi:glycosyltransferase family 2 protein [Brachybacterium hainanense]|uniref:Glycosyltransferase family 2 protein n=1 Tax=Brachybacterium hainanense TaxID=1541174 RepID=A0ABV6RFP4_9MICO
MSGESRHERIRQDAADTQPPEDVVASVVVPTFRGIDRLPALMDAFAVQGPDSPAFEVVVVVDGVDDGSPALVEAEDRFRTRTIVFPENRGRVAALNAGLAAARGEILIRCDDDLVPGPDYIAEHVAAHSPSPRAVIGLYRNEYARTRYAEVYGQDADRRFRAGAYEAPVELRWRYWAGNCSVHRSAYETVGEYDPAYRLYGWEDVDYGYRLHRAGFEVMLVPSLETPHRVAAVTARSRAVRAKHAAAARRIFEAKHPECQLPPAIPPASAWNLLVRGAAPLIGSRAEAAGAFVDRIIPRLPAAVGRKLVALLVEASAVAGYRRPDAASDVF